MWHLILKAMRRRKNGVFKNFCNSPVRISGPSRVWILLFSNSIMKWSCTFCLSETMAFKINYHWTDLANRKDFCEPNKKTGCVHINRVLFVCQTYQISPYFKTSSFTETISTSSFGSHYSPLRSTHNLGRHFGLEKNCGHDLFRFLMTFKIKCHTTGGRS